MLKAQKTAKKPENKRNFVSEIVNFLAEDEDAAWEQVSSDFVVDRLKILDFSKDFNIVIHIPYF